MQKSTDWLAVRCCTGFRRNSGSLLTTTAIAAEASSDENSYVGVIDLSDLANASGSGFTVTSADKYGAFYKIEIQQSGTYKLTGSNYINDSYVDVEITAGSGVTANIVCDNAYIKNDNQDSLLISGSDYHAVIMFNTEDTGKIELSGTLQVDTAESTWELIGAGGNVSGQFFELNYKKESGDNIGTTYFLSGEGNTYKDQSGFSSPYPCVKYKGGSSFDPDNITAAGEVICYDTHANDGTGKCSRCDKKIDYIAEIDLSKIFEYCTNNPFGGNVEVENYYNEYYIVWVKKSGSYKITGSNCVNNAYVDVKFSTYDVTADLYFDYVYIKNDYGYAYESGGLQHDYTSLFDSFFNGGLSGKLRVDTRFFDEDKYVAPIGGPDEIVNKFLMVNYKTPDGDHIDTTYFLKGGTYSDDVEALKDFRCIGVNGKPFDISNISGDSDVTVICSKDHTEGDGACEKCGKKIYTVAFGDSEEKVYDGELLENAPTNPKEEIGKKFAGWFDENGEEFDPTVPITGNVRYTANYADRDVKKISLAERPADSYIEGSKFDPTGLKLTVTYDDDREKVVEYSADDSNFEFLPALDQELTTADTKVSVSYRGSSAVDIPITVAEKKITAAPVISPNGGTFTGSQKVSITCPTAGAVIYYTTDGTTPTAASTKYAGEFTITATTTVKAIAVSEGMNDSTVTSAAFTKKTSGSSGGSSRPTKPAATDSKTDTNPTIDGKSQSWSDICIYIKNLPAGSTSVINMNGETKLPADVIKAISESKAKIELVADSSKSWIIDGSKIITVSAADFSILPGNADKSGLRGVTGADIKINNIGIPADLKLTFRKEFAGQFANLYKVVDGKLVFQSCARVGDDGTSVVSGTDSKGEYVVMVCKFSDIVGDMSNDGVLDERDSSAILKSIIGAESGANPLMADFNGDGTVNALDASAILKLIAGI